MGSKLVATSKATEKLLAPTTTPDKMAPYTPTDGNGPILEARYGTVKNKTRASDAFCARSYAEDCWLMGGNRGRADWRVELETGTVLWTKGSKIIAEFGPS